MLTRQDSRSGNFENEWFILQDIFSGVYAKNKKGYKYSSIVADDFDAISINYIRPLAKKAPQKKTTKPEKKEWIVLKYSWEQKTLLTKKERDEEIRNLSFNCDVFRISKKYNVVRTNDFTLEEVK